MQTKQCLSEGLTYLTEDKILSLWFWVVTQTLNSHSRFPNSVLLFADNLI